MVTRINDLNLKYRESVMDTEIKTVRKLSIFHPVLDPIANQAPKSKEWFPNPDILVSIQSAENKKGHTSIPKTSTTDIFVDRITGLFTEPIEKICILRLRHGHQQYPCVDMRGHQLGIHVKTHAIIISCHTVRS